MVFVPAAIVSDAEPVESRFPVPFAPSYRFMTKVSFPIGAWIVVVQTVVQFVG